jgi:hypothetical protein
MFVYFHHHLVGLGQNSVIVIGATVALDGNCMRFAHSARCHTKSQVVAPEVFVEIVRVSWNGQVVAPEVFVEIVRVSWNGHTATIFGVEYSVEARRSKTVLALFLTSLHRFRCVMTII